MNPAIFTHVEPDPVGATALNPKPKLQAMAKCCKAIAGTNQNEHL
jgi:hypothetical protein